MDYKKIIKSRSLRSKILNMLRFVPDKQMVQLQYYIKLGRRLNLNNPKRFTEKLQWYKLYYHNQIMHQCVDKYEVRDFVKSKGLSDILVDLYGVYDSVDCIELNDLPNSFVIKTTNGGGGLNVVICNDKNKLDISKLRKQLVCIPTKPNCGGREWAYYGLNSRIIVEELLINSENPDAGVNDYKIFCYNGVAKFIVVDTDRYIGHRRNFYDRNWNNLYIESDCPKCDYEIEKPENFDKMIKIAEKLSEDFPFVRVDLYNVNGDIFFGEMTFYPWSGYVEYNPDSFDYKLGEKFDLTIIGEKK